MSRLSRRAIAAVAVALLALACAEAGAEQSSRDGVGIVFNGSVDPHRLPRHDKAPISITLSGRVHSTDGSPPPRLGQIELVFGARGGISTAGLARCPRPRLAFATQGQALERCRDALIGRGSIATEVPLDPSRPLIAHARLLAFNGRAHGRPAVWLHAYSAWPPVSFVLPFYGRSLRGGTFGVSMRAPVARVLGRWPRLRAFHITLGRTYRTGGGTRSYLRAHCPLPPSFDHLEVPIARATYRFVLGPTISATVHRNCQVRE